MLKAFRITNSNIGDIEALYETFCKDAGPRYRWEHDPVGFDILKKAIAGGGIGGYWLEDTGIMQDTGILEANGKNRQTALMLFTREEHRAIEINVIHTVPQADGNPPPYKNILDTLMRAFIRDLQADEAGLRTFDVISYAMMGDQEPFVRSILWYGFKPVGQAIVKFDIMDPVSLQILKQQAPAPLPEGYRIVSWAPQYAGGVARVIYESFSKASDAQWDPRFRSELGAKKVVGMMTYGMMGDLCEESTSILLKGEEAVGVCFLIQSSMTTGNIPLIGVLPEEKKKQFGSHLLQHTVAKTVQAILDGKMGMLSIDATHDTDNLSAIKMYRRMGFREDYNYPHVYLPTEKLRAFKPGQWC
ncbi:MAG: GNAT family N-acetyltransferase [Vampirovibrionales bacterium]|nr:GNAT family N-acetyltransferase [Vampirovibrionales bacterium]